MVKLFGLCILYKGQNSAIWLKSAYDLQSFGYFQRNSVEEFMAFTSKTIVERTQNASRQSVKQGGNSFINFSNISSKLLRIHFQDISRFV